MINYRFCGKSNNPDIKSIFLVDQIHSSDIFNLINPNQLNDKIDADAIITALPNITIGVVTADCMPILVYDPIVNIIAAIHAGWRGVYASIIENTIQKMRKTYGCLTENLIAKIGPAITQNSYEVGEEFYQKWLNLSSVNEKYFLHNSSIYFDLVAVAIDKLLNLGLKEQHIENSAIDTFSNEEYYSYRRSFKAEKIELGRNISIISMAI